MDSYKSPLSKLSLAGLIVTLGIVYGDLGTSPLYVMKAIVANRESVTPDFILGALSCIIWTLTIQTTVKYIILTLRADNKGEGGIFSLFALIRQRGSWAFLFVIIGGSALLADGVITPSITVVAAVEGLKFFNPNFPVIPIALLIIAVLFFIQKFGTAFVGRSFGPIMAIWFTMLAVLGLMHIADAPYVFKAFSPYYAIHFLTSIKGGFLLLGAVFLCTTGAEALYSDLGHCGLKNIRVSWIYVKTTLILNYLGQGAWILSHPEISSKSLNPFFGIMPDWFLLPGTIIATMAAVIASQALISGSYTLISEASSLNFWPRIKIKYPSDIKGRMYVPSINTFLFIAVVLVILRFKDSSSMEAAYGLAITITMLMTTVLLSLYLYYRKTPVMVVGLILAVYFTVEISFLIANFNKFSHGGYVTIIITGLLAIIMYVWYKGRKLKNQFLTFVPLKNYLNIIKDLSRDESVPKYATNLIYTTRANKPGEIEMKIISSILNKQPKRADMYWFLHVDIMDEPDTLDYKITQYIPGVIIKVDFRIGFKIVPRLNLFFKRVFEELVINNEIDGLSRYESLQKHRIVGDCRFVLINRVTNPDFDLPGFDQLIMDISEFLKSISLSEVRFLGLDTSAVTIEQVPLAVGRAPFVAAPEITRVYK